MIERRLAEVPGAEWWDLPLLNASSYEGPPGGSLAANVVLEGISHLIEHPVPIAPPAEPPPPLPMPLPLTKRERKKLRTQRRLAAEKEKQDQIRCGLLAPPPAKVKISNLMTAMTNEAVADPSAVEAKVRSEMAQRMKNHEERNAARKLTPAERKAKKHRKLTNDPSGGGTPRTGTRGTPRPPVAAYRTAAQWRRAFSVHTFVNVMRTAACPLTRLMPRYSYRHPRLATTSWKALNSSSRQREVITYSSKTITVPATILSCSASKICRVELYKSQSTFMKRTGPAASLRKPGSVWSKVPT
jgi:hypothetical protein